MSYSIDIEILLDTYIVELTRISKENQLDQRVEDHLNRTTEVRKEIASQKPENNRNLIEHLDKEGRMFGWSYPENSDQEKCENLFWNFKNSIKSIVIGMTINERLFFFGYIEEYESINPKHISKRERIEEILFMI
ncbi:hypothetical protein [Flagellimonas sp. CMM7]|uniref:hypothetical protein n=1 Tax=Flagellimonas sp. CMM7 TaxID=2654676 RepID=UPI0013D75C58|nr:hypothetical protein [Flagellimonas sp. CMM7]UII79168.1 hypothetical protein LV704_16090 [Flagellimonas sp. CMM7]